MSELIDNRTQRIATLKHIIEHLHSGAAPEAVRTQLREMVRKTDATEIMAMEQELIKGGMPVEEVRSMCDLHSQVTREVLVNPASAPLPAGHPVDTFRKENAALAEVVLRGRELAMQINVVVDASSVAAKCEAMLQIGNELIEVDKHYQRKEHALFSCLERHGIAGPSKVMWAKDDDARKTIKEMIRLTRAATTVEDVRTAVESLVAALNAVQEMIFKEENILLPMSLQTLTEEEWAEIWAVSPRYGWCIVEPGTEYRPAVTDTAAVPTDGKIMLPTGNMSVEQLTALFSALPIDVTFVDADDRVAFFSEGPDRVFARSKAIIGRKVQNCHPPSSVGTVEQILSDFREGRQNVAEFWIEMRGKFIHIRYFAVRGTNAEYLGTLEVTQDATAIRNLKGERRLLSYSTSA